MDTITLTLTHEEAVLIKDALNNQAVNYSGESKTVVVDCMHPDIYHRLWIDTTKLWCKVYDVLYPETEKED